MRCNYNDMTCILVPAHLLLAICIQGHIREKYLCQQHSLGYVQYLTWGQILCPDCGSKLSGEYLTREMIDGKL